MDKDPLFKDYELADYQFVVVNKWTLTPLVWKFEETKTAGSLYYGRNKQIELEDPESIGKTLSLYLSSSPTVPMGIDVTGPNSLNVWLNKI